MPGKEYWDSAQRGGRWLAAQQAADGSWAGLDTQMVDGFYKGAWALIMSGQSPAAQRLLDYVQTSFLRQDGDFAPRENIWHVEVHYLYANAYITIGAMLAGRYEIAQPAACYIETQQSPEGGFFSEKVPVGQRGPVDSVSTAAAGLAMLATGRLAAARRAGDFLVELTRRQPDSTHFYGALEASGELMTDFSDPARNRCRMIDTTKPNQCWYAAGLPFAFAIQLHEATGEMKYRDLAHWLYDFQKKCVNPWDGGSSGKAGWACSMLYRMTGEQEYLDVALQVADFIGKRQNPEGNWARGAIAYGRPPEEQEALTNGGFDLTEEYTLWMSLISANLMAREA